MDEHDLLIFHIVFQSAGATCGIGTALFAFLELFYSDDAPKVRKWFDQKWSTLSELGLLALPERAVRWVLNILHILTFELYWHLKGVLDTAIPQTIIFAIVCINIVAFQNYISGMCIFCLVPFHRAFLHYSIALGSISIFVYVSLIIALLYFFCINILSYDIIFLVILFGLLMPFVACIFLQPIKDFIETIKSIKEKEKYDWVDPDFKFRDHFWAPRRPRGNYILYVFILSFSISASFFVTLLSFFVGISPLLSVRPETS